MTLIKKSQRTLREGCKKCGTKEVYWAQDTSRPVGKQYLMIDANSITRAYSQGQQVGQHHLHACFKSEGGAQPESTPVEVLEEKIILEAEKLDVPEQPAPYVTSVPEIKFTPEQIAIQKALGVDPDAIGAIAVEAAKAALKDIVYPTRTVIVKDNVHQEIEGSTHKALADVLLAVMASEHVLMVGPAGTGKSTIASQVAKAMGLKYYSISCHPQLPVSQIVGYMQAQGEMVITGYYKWFTKGGLWHWDEADNMNASSFAVVNASLANGHMMFADGEMVEGAQNRVTLASANTYGRGANGLYVGRSQIDAATLDRFTVITIEIDEALETQVCMATGLAATSVEKVLTYVRKLRKAADSQGLRVVL